MNTQKLRILALLFLFPALAMAQQDCRCCAKQAEGQALFDKKQYEAAINKWEYALGLSDKDKCPNLSKLIYNARQRIKERDENAAKAQREKEKREAAAEKQKQADIAWGYIRLATNAEPFEQFLRDYPDSRQAPEARRLRDLYKPEPTETAQKDPPATPKQENTAPVVASFLVKIPGGTFLMGDQFGDGQSDELPLHKVTLSDFYLSKYEVSFDEFDAFCNATGCGKPEDLGWGRGKRPVIKVNWYDAIEYCNWLSKEHGLQIVYTIDKGTEDFNNKNDEDAQKWKVNADWNANGYRLPTEAEWEYAARAVMFDKAQGGGKVRFGNGQNVIDPSEVNFNPSNKMSYSNDGEYRVQTVCVDQLSANAFGIINMSGNVWEWCWDWYDPVMYKYTKHSRNPKGPHSGENRVLRGNAWDGHPGHCRSSERGYEGPYVYHNNTGFRVARSL